MTKKLIASTLSQKGWHNFYSKIVGIMFLAEMAEGEGAKGESGVFFNRSSTLIRANVFISVD